MADSKDGFETIRVRSALKTRLEDLQDEVRRREGKKPTVSEVIEQSLGRPDSTGPAELPGPFEGLRDDQVWLLHNLIEILRAAPQDAIYRTALHTLSEAVAEWRRSGRSTHTGTQEHSPQRATRKTAQHELHVNVSTPSLTDLETIALERALRVIRSPKPGLPDALLSNITMFSEFAELYERTLDPAAGSAPRNPTGAGESNSGVDSLVRDAQQLRGRLEDARRTLDELDRSRKDESAGETSHPRPARKRG